MKTTKLFPVLVYILAFLALSISSFAQDKEMKNSKTPEEKAKFTLERLKTSLNLTDEQSAKVYELNLQRIKDHKGFKEGMDKIKSDRKQKQTEYKNSLKSILTEEQVKNMEKMHKDKKLKKQHKKRNHHKR